MRLDRVTITGADDSVKPADLLRLSQKYPFAEWGILVSRSSEGTPRYPLHPWIKLLQRAVQDRYHDLRVKLSLHLCGYWVRQLLMGQIHFPMWILDEFDRVQLNFHAERNDCLPDEFCSALRALGGQRQFIFQLDGVLGNRHMQAVLTRGPGIDVAPLYDISGGAGILPASWPKPVPNVYMGYAGGLGPDNLEEQIPKIAEAAGGALHWIDMETRVRSHQDRIFDLSKVERCLEIAAGHIMEGAHGAAPAG